MNMTRQVTIMRLWDMKSIFDKLSDLC